VGVDCDVPGQNDQGIEIEAVEIRTVESGSAKIGTAEKGAVENRAAETGSVSVAGSSVTRKSAGLERKVRAHIVPLCLLVFGVVTFGAPSALVLLRYRELRSQGKITAYKAAGLIQRELDLVPDLWEYNTPKLKNSLHAYRRRSGVHWIIITDSCGVPLVFPEGVDGIQDIKIAVKTERLLWSAAPIRIRNQLVGKVWVAVRISRRGGLLFLVFGLVGLVTAALVYVIPLRVVRLAERRITHLIAELRCSGKQLSELNRTLEDKVAERSLVLQNTLEELKVKESRLRTLSARSLAFQESERRAIGRELHDETGQALTATRINLQIMQEKAAKSEDVSGLARDTLSLLDNVISEVRRLMDRLGPSILEELSLVEAIERLCEGTMERTGIYVRMEVDTKTEAEGERGSDTKMKLGSGEPYCFSPAVETACYRIVQEALTNAARHSQAECVDVKLVHDFSSKCLYINIEDDGVGLVPDSIQVSGNKSSGGQGEERGEERSGERGEERSEERSGAQRECRSEERSGRRKRVSEGGLGLAGIRERVELLGGELEIVSSPGEGAKVCVVVPITD